MMLFHGFRTERFQAQITDVLGILENFLGNNMEGATRKTALEEFVECLVENGGELDLDRAVLLLSQSNRKFVLEFGALEFIKMFP